MLLKGFCGVFEPYSVVHALETLRNLVSRLIYLIFSCINEEMNPKVSARPVQVCRQCSILLRQLRTH